MSDDSVHIPKEFLKRLRLKEGEGGGSGSFSTSLALASGLSALAGGRSYAPAHAAAMVREMSGYVNAMEAENSLNIGPSPGGTSTPDTGRDDDFATRRKQNRVNPNLQPESTTYADGSKEVVLESNGSNAFITSGKINGSPVLFLLDTGATQVSIPERVANSLGLKGEGSSSSVQTASGTVAMHNVMLDTLSVGSIDLNYIAAVINPADRGETILLGMSALKRLQFTHDDGRLILKQKA